MNEKKIKLRKLISLYVFTVFLTIILVTPTHIFPPTAFMYARFPHYLEMMEPFLGVSWPMTFEIYHYVLYTLAIIGALNVLGIVFYPRLKQIAFASSLIGLFLISPMVLFFFFVFSSVNLSTAIIYGLYSVVLLTVNILTFKVLIRPQKEVRRE